jgi:hypothetical protein
MHEYMVPICWYEKPFTCDSKDQISALALKVTVCDSPGTNLLQDGMEIATNKHIQVLYSIVHVSCRKCNSFLRAFCRQFYSFFMLLS